MSNSAPPKKEPLDYPFKINWSPPPGEPFEVYPGVFWLHMPLPFSLERINLWLLKDKDADGNECWTLVDTGMYDEKCKAVWEKVFETFCPPTSIKQIIVTHSHPDHLGLAEWLRAKADCKVYISEGEYKLYRNIRARKGDMIKPNLEQYITLMGGDQDQLELYLQMVLPSTNNTLDSDNCEFIDHNFSITVGDIHWKVVPGNGHSPEHCCLYAEQEKLFISGDQALPRISSNVSLHMEETSDNPLNDWLVSCARLRDEVDESVLVLPAHQEPFYGLPKRMQQLIDGHNHQLDTLEGAIADAGKPQGCSVFESCAFLFQRELNAIDRLLAMGETHANLRYLQKAGRAESSQDQAGTLRFLSP